MRQVIETKEDLMKAIYSQDELRNIDVALPRDTWDKVDTSIHVMNYNNGFGELQNLIEVAFDRSIPIAYQLPEYFFPITETQFFEDFTPYLNDDGTLMKVRTAVNLRHYNEFNENGKVI